MILVRRGMSGREASYLIRSKREGALSNLVFRKFLEGL
jgi:hypothetical protein